MLSLRNCSIALCHVSCIMNCKAKYESAYEEYGVKMLKVDEYKCVISNRIYVIDDRDKDICVKGI